MRKGSLSPFKESVLKLLGPVRISMAEEQTDSNKDRFSELSADLKGSILERMIARDAARTSILSKKWRYIWASHPQLKLDEQFFFGITPNKRINQSLFVRIIDKIFLLHHGPIQKFILYIPFSQSPDMDFWILILSRNGIKELTLDNGYVQPYKLPSYIYSCAELTYLELVNCIIFNPPLEFHGFPYLKKLFLENISISPRIGSLISGLPALNKLSLSSCTSIENLKILPPKLIWFVVVNSHEFEWQCFKTNSSLLTLYVAMGKEVQNVYEQEKHFNLTTLLANLPRLVRLWLDGFSLKFLAAGVVLKCQLNFSLKDIYLISLRFNDLDQVSCALCLLRSSPFLKNLKIDASTDLDEAGEQVVNYMEAQGLEMGLNQLQTVTIGSFNGLKAEVFFARLLLSQSPSLELMEIDNRSGIDAKEGLRISTELMRFPRASNKAEIVYVP
ncbi:hypothetical protein LguiB_028019 [Lonicera macranthoides]